MFFYGLLLFMLAGATLAVLWAMWLRDWDGASMGNKVGFLLLPWLPFTFLAAYNLLYGPDLTYYPVFLGLLGFFALGASVVNIYRSLWGMLLSLSQGNRYLSPGLLLLRISLAIVLTITGIILLFSLGYALTTYLYEGTGINYIAQGPERTQRVETEDLASFFYFSSVTYFSLGDGDYAPKGNLMLFLVYLESLLGYINSGILIAYAFHLFTRLSATGARLKNSMDDVPKRLGLRKGFFR
ncbi:MAG: ion channel [Clostridia bacterium]|nr:ion channel [Clostridia bacterium]